MDLCNKILSKTPISWADVQKQLLNVLQSRTNVNTTSTLNTTSLNPTSTSLVINKAFVKQCTDFLIKNIKNLNQTQIIDHLENLAQSSGLMVYKTPSEDDPKTLNAFLNTDDFYFEVSINSKGEIIDVKFSICSEPAKSSCLLKEIFCSWNWDLLSKHIEGIKSNFILADPDHQIRTKGFKSIQYLEKDLNNLYQIEVKYLEKMLKITSTKSITSENQIKYIDKLINQTPIGVLKKSELGQPMRLYYYLSPLDLIQHHTKNFNQNQRFNSAQKIFGSLSIDQLIQHELGSYVSISLQSTRTTTNTSDKNEQNSENANQMEVEENLKYRLPDSLLLVLNENDDDKTLQEYLNPYFNVNFNFERNPLFKRVLKNNTLTHNSVTNNTSPTQSPITKVPGTYIVNLNKPIVMCLSTLNQLQTQIGVETISIESIYKADKLTPFFELLAKTSIKNKVLNEAYSVQLPDENQVYYINELEQTSTMGVVIEKLLFVHPQDLVLILETLRKQLLFNELLLSCMRKLCTSALSISCSNNNYDLNNYNYSNGKNTNNVRILEIGLIEPFVISIMMQHPKLLCYTTIEIDVSKRNVETRFRDHNDLHNPNVISEIIRRCHSIPVTIRALLMKYRQTSNITTKRKLNLNNNNSGNSDSNGNNHNTTSNNDSNNLYHSNNNSTSNRNNNDNNDANDYSYGNQNSNNHYQKIEFESNQEDEIPITPRCLLGNETPRRMTPSRSDSYNRSNSSSSSSNTNSSKVLKTPSSILSSIFNFSNLISDQKLQQQKLLKEESISKSQSIINSDDLTVKLKKQHDSADEKSDHLKQYKTQTSLDSSPFTNSTSISSSLAVVTTPLSNVSISIPTSTKKRKASSSSSNSESLPSTPVQANQQQNQQPSAKRKMTQQSSSGNDLKKNTTDDSKTHSGSSSSGNTLTKTESLVKKAKLKSSQSTNSLSSVSTSLTPNSGNSNNNSIKSSENLVKKSTVDVKSGSTGASITNSATKTEKNIGVKKSSDGGVLTTLVNSNSNNTKNLKTPSSVSSKTNSSNKKSTSSSSTASPPVSINNNIHSLKSNTTAANQMRAKPITEDGLKIRISKDSNSKLASQRSTSSSSINSTPSNNLMSNKNNFNHHNLSATEIQLKQHPSSLTTPPTTQLSNEIPNLKTPLSAVQQLQSSNSNISTRTPSPSSFSSLSMHSTSGMLNTPNILNDADATTASTENEVSSQPQTKTDQTKTKSKINKPLSTPSQLHLSLSAPSTTKPNTPPLQSPSLASSLGLGTTFKASNFKIPHKSKSSNSDSTENADEIKTPLSSSSPIPNQTSTTTRGGSINNNLGSPNKSTIFSSSSSTSDSNKATNFNLKTNSSIRSSSTNSTSNNRNNASPKWQPSYPGSMSPRYINNFESNSSTSPSSISPLAPPTTQPAPPVSSQQQQLQSQASKLAKNLPPGRSQSLNSTRPLTPIPPQFGQNGINSNRPYNYHSNVSKHSQLTPGISLPLPTPSQPSTPQTLTAQKQIPSLMSFNSSNKYDLMTPSSPNSEISQTNDIKLTRIEDSVHKSNVNIPTSPNIPQPPDSPTSETAPMVIPKLIPLERNSSNTTNTPASISSIASSSETITTQTIPLINTNTNKQITESKLKSRAVDIASPDAFIDNEEENDNLVIDLIQNNPTIISTNRTMIASSSSKIANSFNISDTAFSHLQSSVFTSKKLNSNETLIPSTTIIPSTSTRLNIKSPCLGLEEDIVNESPMIS